MTSTQLWNIIAGLLTFYGFGCTIAGVMMIMIGDK